MLSGVADTGHSFSFAPLQPPSAVSTCGVALLIRLVGDGRTALVQTSQHGARLRSFCWGAGPR